MRNIRNVLERWNLFDYAKFEDAIVHVMEQSLKKYRDIHDDLYIVSLDCCGEMSSMGLIANTKAYLAEQTDMSTEDHWYYKYCEEEWCIFDTFEKISFEMYDYMQKMHVSDVDKFDNHRNNIIAACKKALCRLVVSPFYQEYATILLTFNIREYLEQEERIALFELFNGKTMAATEYAEHIEDFV